MVLEGTHGTCVSWKDSILRYGFRTAVGRGGTGTYLWRECPNSKALAVAWYADSYDYGVYRTASNQDCAVIFVELSLGDEEFLDLENPEVRDALTLLAKEQGVRKESKAVICKLINSFVRHLEEKLSVAYRVLQIRVAPPDNAKYFYSVLVSGAPISFVVRDVTCVSNMRAINLTQKEVTYELS